MSSIAKLQLTALIMLAFAIALEAPAWAVSVRVRFCFNLEVYYFDRNDGDYWTEDMDRPAEGIWAEVRRNADGNITFGGWAAAEALACTPYLWLSITDSYRVRLYSATRDANSNTVRVYQGDDGTTYHWQTVDWGFQPSSPGTAYYTYEILDLDYTTDPLGAAQFALAHNPAGLSSRDFVIHGASDKDTAYSKKGKIWLDWIAKTRKTGTTHELGHVVGYMRNGDKGAYSEYSDTGDDDLCSSSADDHLIDSRELQAAAAGEGIAHFYVATTWNDDTEADCEFRGDDCNGGTSRPINWLSHCPLPWAARGNEFDWLRFWWHLHTSVGISDSDVFSIWAGAHPDLWSDATVFDDLQASATEQGIIGEVTWLLWAYLDGVFH